MSPTLHSLPTWADLTDRLDTGGVTAFWARTEPALAGLESAADLAYLTSRQHPGREAMLGAVINLAAACGGCNSDAVLVVLHLLSNGAGALATKLRDLSPVVDDLVLGQLTIQILTAPVGGERVYAAGLLRQTNAVLLKELLPAALPNAAPVKTVRHKIVDLDGVAPESADTPYRELEDLFQWAEQERIASAADLSMLLEFEVAAERGRGARHRLARRHGIHERTVRRRRDRTLAALRTASNRYLQATS